MEGQECERISEGTSLQVHTEVSGGVNNGTDDSLKGLRKPDSGRQALGGSRRLDKLLILVVPTAFFLYLSSRPVFRLRVEMPSRFVDLAPSSASPRQREEERQVALDYWNCAVTMIQWKYAYGSPLPLDPPDEFRVYARLGDTARPARGKDQALDARVRYWKRLRQLWVSPDTWKTSREWSMAWLTDPIYRLIDGFDTYFKDWWRAS